MIKFQVVLGSTLNTLALVTLPNSDTNIVGYMAVAGSCFYSKHLPFG